MGYTERNWKDASILVCNDVNGTLDKTFSEIKEAIENDYVVMVKKTVNGVTTFLDVHTINPTERTLNTKGWIYTATSDEAYATGEADESGEGGGGGGNVTVAFAEYDETTELYYIPNLPKVTPENPIAIILVEPYTDSATGYSINGMLNVEVVDNLGAVLYTLGSYVWNNETERYEYKAEG